MINRIAKIVSIVMVLIMAFTMAVGCKTVEPEEEAVVETSEEASVDTAEEEVEEEAEAEEPETVTITDGSGREVTIKMPVERIVTMGSVPMLVVIKALGAGDKVVGVLDYIVARTTFLPELSKLPSVGNNEALDYERIFELEPDIVIAPYYVFPGELEEKLEPEILVVRLDVGPPLTYAEDVKKLGLILKKEDRAVEYINWYQNYVDNIVEKIGGLSEDDKPRVFEYYGGGAGSSTSEGPPYGTYGKENIWVNPIFEMAGAVNITADLPGDWIAVDPEWVIEQNPSVIIRELYLWAPPFMMGYDTDNPSEVAIARENIMKHPAFELTDAVKNENVYMIEGELIQCYWFAGIQYMAKWFHPELFEDLDPQVVHKEFLNRFMGLDYDLDKHGVFVYPEPQ